MLIFYRVFILIISPIALFLLCINKKNRPKIGSRWREYFGFTPVLKCSDNPIWIHAVSVGESIAAIPIIKELKQKNPQQNIVVTTTTTTGAEQIAKLGELVEHRYMPLDFCWMTNRFIKIIKPSKLLIMETELWPNTLLTVHKHNIPIIIVNARLSERSYLKYKKIQPLFDKISPTLNKVLCQNKEDGERFSKLGIASENIIITGSVKFDIDITPEIIASGKILRQQLGETRPIWIAASTHDGEDLPILETHKQLLNDFPNLLLILVPRHPERFDKVYKLCLSEGLIATRRSSQQAISNKEHVYLADTMGEMLTLLGASDICFIGGSLIGDKVGGHNILEPAALGIPTIIGPSYYNFKDIVEKLEYDNLITIIKNHDQLKNKIHQKLLLTNNNKKEKLKEFIHKNSSSLNKEINLIIKKSL